jgi:hypothetical protein
MLIDSKSSIFNANHERINLLLPIIFLIVAMIELITWYTFAPEDKNRLLSYGYFLFLNHTHIFLTPLIFLLYPQANSWLKHKDNSDFISKGFFIGTFAIIFVLMIMHLTIPALQAKWISIFAFSATTLLGIRHNIFQSYGFFCLYERKKPSSLRSNYKRMKLYKTLFYVLSFAVAMNAYLIYFSVYNVNKNYLKLVCALIGLLAAGAIVLLTMKEPGFEQSNKTLYSLRLLMVALAPVSVIAFVGYLSVHGIEYLLLFMHMKKDQYPIRQRIVFVLGVASVLFISSVPLMITRHDLTLIVPATLMIIFNAYVYSASMCHYIIDSFLFRFSTPASKEAILPLFIDTQIYEKDFSSEKSNADYGFYKRAR